MTFAEITAAFQKADDAWNAQLVALYGNHAGCVRYTHLGRGDAGTDLRAAYDTRAIASNLWADARQYA